MNEFFKSVIDSDISPIVICDTSHKILYLNPTAAARYAKRGGYALVGKNLLDCHSADSREKIMRVLEWFGESTDNNRVYEFHNEKENRDVYMMALRDETGKLIGYYEKHEIRTGETAAPYTMNNTDMEK